MIYLLDMDGVCVDFLTGAVKLFRENYVEIVAKWPLNEYDIPKVLNITTSEFWEAIDEGGADFWSDLEEYPWFHALYKELRKSGEVVFLTCPSWNPVSVAGKVRWLKKRLGITFSNYIISPLPKSFFATGQTILVDDNWKNVLDFREAGGEAVLFPQRYNFNKEPPYDPRPWAVIYRCRNIKHKMEGKKDEQTKTFS